MLLQKALFVGCCWRCNISVHYITAWHLRAIIDKPRTQILRSPLVISMIATSFYYNPTDFFLLIALFLRWLVIAVGLVRAYLAKGSYHSLYYSIEKPLKFFQTGALLEVGPEICC